MRGFQLSASAIMRRKGWAIAAAAMLLIVGAIGIAWLYPQLTHYIEDDHFRAELEKDGGGSDLRCELFRVAVGFVHRRLRLRRR